MRIGEAMHHLGTQVIADLDQLPDSPQPGTEMDHLARIHEGALITAPQSLHAALFTAARAAQAFALVADSDNVPDHDPAAAGLLRQIMMGAYPVIGVLGPPHPEEREQAARELVAADYASLSRAARKARGFVSQEMTNLAAAASEILGDVAVDADSHPELKAHAKTAAQLIDRGAEQFASILRAHARTSGDDSAGWARVESFAPEAANILWQAASGHAHAFSWPLVLMAPEDIPGLSPHAFRALDYASALHTLASRGSRDDYTGFHALLGRS